MQAQNVSATALITAFARAYHASQDVPKIFDDYLAVQMLTEGERAYFSHSLAQALQFFNPQLAATQPDPAAALEWVMKVQNAPITLSRARYTEECLDWALAHGVSQYVILGAGMETFAFRRPVLLDRLSVFEVDTPATLAFKQGRLADLGWEIPPQLAFVPLDFAQDSLCEALEAACYDPRQPSFFSWLGVTFYLEKAVVWDTLTAIRGVAAAGSSLVFDYIEPQGFDPVVAAVRMQRMQAIVARVGEPMRTWLDPAVLAVELARAGFHLKESLSPAEIEGRYFAGRTDGYHAFEHVHFAWAQVG
ncbi:MAG: class I SAM-dependent methyltransferase [Anaerolineales bacterium]|nr:class I SAM-dependent methyltransferase [Anaerolineales bacterium]